MSKPNPSKFNIPQYDPGRFSIGPIRATVYGSLVTIGIFFVVPFTQILSGLEKKDREIRSFDIVQPPPPPPPELEEPPEEPPPEEPPPEMSPPPPPLNLSQLELALNPGIGDAMAGGMGFGGFDVQPDAAADLMLFDVKDLDEIPRPVRQVKMEPPIRFKRERISGIVRLEIMIDEEGRTKVLEILETTHSDLEEPARLAAEQWIWTPPKKNGEEVRARYVFPIGFKF